VEADEAWETGEGIWYRRRGVVTLLERDKVKAIGKPRKERLKHSRRRGQSVQQQKHGRIFRAGLSVEDGQSVYLDRAIKSRMFHEAFLSLGLGQKLK